MTKKHPWDSNNKPIHMFLSWLMFKTHQLSPIKPSRRDVHFDGTYLITGRGICDHFGGMIISRRDP